MKENAYEMPWRTNYEAMAAAGWLVGATGAIGTSAQTTTSPSASNRGSNLIVDFLMMIQH